MATQYSNDLFLEDIYLIVIFPTDGTLIDICDSDPAIRKHNGGDIVYVERESEEDKELAVVLGWGETREEAVKASKEYIARVMRWHGQDPGSFVIMGFDVTESQVLA